MPTTIFTKTPIIPKPTKIKTLITEEDLDDCPKTDTPQYSVNDKAAYLDFEELVKQGTLRVSFDYFFALLISSLINSFICSVGKCN